jgi:hypothetical protein
MCDAKDTLWYCSYDEFYVGNHDDIFEIVERLKKADFLMMKLQNPLGLV